MADWDTVFSGIQTGSNVLNSFITNGLNISNHILSRKQFQLQRDSFEWQKNYDMNQTQIRVDDMAKAGLNPILAAGSAGGSSVSGVSATPATPVQPHNNDFQSLIELGMQKRQLNLQDKIASESNKTAESVAETKAESDKEVARLYNETARLNAQLNAQTQTSIATANNEAMAEVRFAEARHFNGLADKQDWQNAYNALFHRYDGNPGSVIGFLDSGKNEVASWLGVGIDKAAEFIKWVKEKIRENSRTPKSEFDLGSKRSTGGR